ncbi:MAG: endo alpha-1,4 polygalactosaminidase [Chryseolinea sp.]
MVSLKNLFRVLFVVLITASCGKDDDPSIPDLDFRQEMRVFVEGISTYSKNQKTNFLIIPQNGQEILTTNSENDGALATEYVSAIDAVGREDLFYGYTSDDVSTPTEDHNFLIDFCNVAKVNGKVVLTTDYCSTHSKMDDSYTQNQTKGYVSFAADHRELDNVPTYPATIHNVNDSDVTQIGDVKNFLYLINPSAYSTKQSFLDAIKNTNYDMVLIDLYFNDEQLTLADVASLKVKLNGGSRLVICYMSIGEAEDYRYYWSDLNKSLIYRENTDWEGNFSVKYWETSWKDVIYGNDQSYTKKILDTGFDGVYLDIIEAYEYFE